MPHPSGTLKRLSLGLSLLFSLYQKNYHDVHCSFGLNARIKTKRGAADLQLTLNIRPFVVVSL